MQPTVPQPVFLNVEYLFSQLFGWLGDMLRWIFSLDFLNTLKNIAAIFIILGIALIIYCLVRLYEFHQEDIKKTKKTTTATKEASSGVSSQSIHTTPDITNNPTWTHVRTRLLSDSPAEWRLAIIEADIYLDRVLDDKGFHGETLGDKLKQLSPEALPSVQLAWDAHKIRNRIAHDGAAFTLTQPEARRALSYYEIVFRDLEVIA